MSLKFKLQQWFTVLLATVLILFFTLWCLSRNELNAASDRIVINTEYQLSLIRLLNDKRIGMQDGITMAEQILCQNLAWLGEFAPDHPALPILKHRISKAYEDASMSPRKVWILGELSFITERKLSEKEVNSPLPLVR